MTAENPANSKKHLPSCIAGAGTGFVFLQFVQELPETFPHKAELLEYAQSAAPFITIIFVLFGFEIQAWWERRKFRIFQEEKTRASQRIDSEIALLEKEIDQCEDEDKPELKKRLAEIKRRKVEISESFLRHHLDKYEQLGGHIRKDDSA